MGKITGFIEYERVDENNEAVKDRLKNFSEFTIPLKEKELEKQGSRCMDCGIPFCHSACPLGNLIPDFNEFIYKNEWEKALEILHSTNNFPEFTGRLCPAPCEKSCVLGIIDNPVSIENIEKNIVEKGFEKGWIVAKPPKERTDKNIAVVGSGPAGLAAAQQLNRAGHTVTVFERDDAIGGLLRYGIPNFKLDKVIIDRRLEILESEGINFKTNTNIGVNFPVKDLDAFDAVILCGGATERRSLPTKGIDAKGIEQAMDFLTQQTKSIYGVKFDGEVITAKGKNVIVIGGGDTGSDCIGTSNRQGAKSVINFEIMPKPPVGRSETTPWPFWPLQLNTSSSHEEGCERNWLINTKEFITNDKGELTALKTIEVEWKILPGTRPKLIEIEGTEKIWPCDLVLLALGFTAGDMRRGQSLIVWAISEGREAAREVDIFLMGESNLPRKGNGDLPGV